MVQGEGPFEPVSGDMAGGPVLPRVVDQYVDPGKPVEHLGGQASHPGLGGRSGTNTSTRRRWRPGLPPRSPSFRLSCR